MRVPAGSIESISLKKFCICYSDPLGDIHRIEHGGYVIDSKCDYWFELYFTPKDGFAADGLKDDGVEAFVNNKPAKFMYLFNPCPEDMLPGGLAKETFVIKIGPFSSLLDEKKEFVEWDFDLDGGTEPEAGLFGPYRSVYLYKQGDTVLPEEFACFRDKNPKKTGFTFDGWEYRICEYNLIVPPALISEPLGKYGAAASAFDFDAGIPLDVALSELPGTISPKSYHIKFKALWKKDDTPGNPGGTPGKTPDKTTTGKVPDTGDDNGILIAFMSLSASLACLVTLRAARKRTSGR